MEIFDTNVICELFQRLSPHALCYFSMTCKRLYKLSNKHVKELRALRWYKNNHPNVSLSDIYIDIGEWCSEKWFDKFMTNVIFHYDTNHATNDNEYVRHILKKHTKWLKYCSYLEIFTAAVEESLIDVVNEYIDCIENEHFSHIYTKIKTISMLEHMKNLRKLDNVVGEIVEECVFNKNANYDEQFLKHIIDNYLNELEFEEAQQLLLLTKRQKKIEKIKFEDNILSYTNNTE